MLNTNEIFVFVRFSFFFRHVATCGHRVFKPEKLKKNFPKLQLCNDESKAREK